ncbi:MAG: hypothetical protein ACHQF0_05270 [Chitinophagales bacterium]
MLRKLICFSFFSILAILLFTFQISVTSCTKTNTIIDTVTKIQTDTVTKIQIDTLQEKDTTLTAAILTANSWKLQELRTIVGGIFQYYVRGGTNNTESWDNEYITFNSNNTGLYTGNAGDQYSITWSFTDATNKQLVFTLNYPTPVTITWENIVYDDGAIRYTEYYTQNGGNVLTSAVRIPK